MLNFLAPYLSLFGLTSFSLIAAAGVVAWFLPFFRNIAILVAVAVAVMFGSYTTGVRDTQAKYAAAAQQERDRQNVANEEARRAAEIRDMEHENEMRALRAENETLRTEADADDDAKRVALPKRSIERINRTRQ